MDLKQSFKSFATETMPVFSLKMLLFFELLKFIALGENSSCRHAFFISSFISCKLIFIWFEVTNFE